MAEAVLDASALLAFLGNEPGADKLAAFFPENRALHARCSLLSCME